MSGTKVQKTVLLSLEMLSWIDEYAKKKGKRFPTAFEEVVGEGIIAIKKKLPPIGN